MLGTDVHAEQMCLVTLLGARAYLEADKTNQFFAGEATEARQARRYKAFGELFEAESRFVFIRRRESLRMKAQSVKAHMPEGCGVIWCKDTNSVLHAELALALCLAGGIGDLYPAVPGAPSVRGIQGNRARLAEPVRGQPICRHAVSMWMPSVLAGIWAAFPDATVRPSWFPLG